MSMIRALTVLTLLAAAAPLSGGEIKLEKADDRVNVTVDGKPFTSYLFKGRAKPILYPVHGPDGTAMTRRFPIEDARDTEAKDHPHHASLWFTHGDVNGVSYWHIGKNTGTIVNDSVAIDGPTIVSNNKWIDSKGKVHLTDTTKITFAAGKDARTIDFVITLNASEGDVKFGETKEGSMGIRSHPNLRLQGKSANAKAMNSEGGTGKGIWGKSAKWVAYWGKIDDKPVGFAIFDHPSNPRHPTGWHARDYGLVAANPFGGHVFDRSKPKGTGTLNLKKGESVTLRYRFVFYTGEASAERVGQWYESYGSTKSAGVERTDVFVSGTDGYHTFRIPSVIAAANGDLLAFSEGRVKSRSDTGNIDLVMRRSTDGGKTWGPLRLVWDDAGNTCGNPCPVVDARNGRIHLLLTWNRGDDHESKIKAGTSKDTRRVFVMTSDDHGATWSKARQITDTTKASDWGWYATGPGAGIQLTHGKHKGRLIIPCDHSVMPWKSSDSFRSHAIYSDDGGETWQRSAPITPGVNECEVVELIDGRLMMNMRNYRRSKHRARAIAFSSDGGRTWSEVTHDATLVEPVCQGSIRRIGWPSRPQHATRAHAYTGVIAFTNPADTKNRHRMTVRLSYDDGKTWPAKRVLYGKSAAYSCIVALPHGRIGVLYEADSYGRIEFASFDTDWVSGG